MKKISNIINKFTLLKKEERVNYLLYLLLREDNAEEWNILSEQHAELFKPYLMQLSMHDIYDVQREAELSIILPIDPESYYVMYPAFSKGLSIEKFRKDEPLILNIFDIQEKVKKMVPEMLEPRDNDIEDAWMTSYI